MVFVVLRWLVRCLDIEEKNMQNLFKEGESQNQLIYIKTRKTLRMLIPL